MARLVLPPAVPPFTMPARPIIRDGQLFLAALLLASADDYAPVAANRAAAAVAAAGALDVATADRARKVVAAH